MSARGANRYDLESALVSLLEEMGRTFPALGGKRGHFVLGSAFDAALESVYRALPPSSNFQDELDLFDAVKAAVPSVHFEAVSSGDLHAPLAQLRSLILDPRPMVFRTTLATHAKMEIACSFGGTRGISVGSTGVNDAEDAACALFLSGTVLAHSPEAAVDEAEATVEEVAGALLAGGLAVPSRGRQRVPQDHARLGVIIDGVDYATMGACADISRALNVGVILGLTELEQRAFEQGDLTQALSRKLGLIGRVLAGDSESALVVRAACRFFARACVSREYGPSVNFSFQALETLLIGHADKGDGVLAPLVAAVVHGAATPHAERSDLGRFIKDAYGDRSKYVHTGRACASRGRRARLTTLVAERIHHEMTLLPQAPTTSG